MRFARSARPTHAEAAVRGLLTEVAREAALVADTHDSFFIESVTAGPRAEWPTAGRARVVTAILVLGTEPDPDYEEDWDEGDLAWLDQLAAWVAESTSRTAGLVLRSWTTQRDPAAVDQSGEVRVAVVFTVADRR